MVEPILPAPTTTIFFMTLSLVKALCPDRCAVGTMLTRIAACLSKGSVELFETNPLIERYAERFVEMLSDAEQELLSLLRANARALDRRTGAPARRVAHHGAEPDRAAGAARHHHRLWRPAGAGL